MLGEGDKLVLYTDGVTEARNSERQMLGMARWTEIVASREDLQQAVKQYTGQAEPTDDITLMTIRKITPVQPVTLRVPNSEDQWPVLRRAIHDFGICTGAEKKVLKKLEVAAEEAVVNILHYSQAVEIELVISHLSGQTGIRIQLIDDGIPFDPTAHETNATAVADRQIGGMGISLIRQIADELQYQRMDDKNQLTIIKHI
jgi:sigma-B regulation protein RsbU (phosphoserine phosphatase)